MVARRQSGAQSDRLQTGGSANLAASAYSPEAFVAEGTGFGKSVAPQAGAERLTFDE
jgi:hypothetical protein